MHTRWRWIVEEVVRSNSDVQAKAAALSYIVYAYSLYGPPSRFERTANGHFTFIWNYLQNTLVKVTCIMPGFISSMIIQPGSHITDYYNLRGKG